MFAVGLDVDTLCVSLNIVIYFIIIRLFAGIFIIRVSPPMLSVVGKILLFIYNCNLNTIYKDKQSAGNPLALYKNDNAKVVFDYDKHLISDDLLLSDHIIKHNKPESEEDFGYYLSGLIEGDGYIGDNRIEIAFHKDDISSAFYIKKRIGYGSVLFLRGKNSVRYVLRKTEGLKKVLLLINGKFLSQPKIDQLINNNYDKKYDVCIKPKANFNILTNHWLAGFADADGSFGIYISKSNTHQTNFNITLPFRIKQKYPELLNIIKEALGGNVYQFNDKMYNYSSTNFKVAYNIANYFDKYHLLNASKYINYLKWRKAYRIIQRKEHLTFEGLAKIRKLQENLRD